MTTCEECGFVYEIESAGTVGSAVVDDINELAVIIGSGGPEITKRHDPGMWSPLEYSCHLRDVLIVQRERVLLGRREDKPTCEPMGRDERVDHDGYGEQRPADVARQAVDAAQLFAGVLARLGPDDWDRTLIYNYPAPAERSLRWVAIHTLHDVRHHLLDVRRQLT